MKKGNTYTYAIKGLEDASYYISARVTDTKGNETQTTAANIHVNTSSSALAGKGWTSKDIGNPDIKGSGSMTGDVITVKGNGKLEVAKAALNDQKRTMRPKTTFTLCIKR